jgi:hypothetical protein
MISKLSLQCPLRLHDDALLSFSTRPTLGQDKIVKGKDVSYAEQREIATRQTVKTAGKGTVCTRPAA